MAYPYYLSYCSKPDFIRKMLIFISTNLILLLCLIVPAIYSVGIKIENINIPQKIIMEGVEATSVIIPYNPPSTTNFRCK